MTDCGNTGKNSKNNGPSALTQHSHQKLSEPDDNTRMFAERLARNGLSLPHAAEAPGLSARTNSNFGSGKDPCDATYYYPARAGQLSRHSIAKARRLVRVLQQRFALKQKATSSTLSA